jgi:membrane AbrB-like protein
MHNRELFQAKAMCLALGAAGGTLFYFLNLPLPWMLGAMGATTVAAMSGLRIAAAPTLRMVFTSILGIMLGSAFTPAVLQSIGTWLGSFGWLIFYVVLATGLVFAFYLRVARYDSVTAYFSAAPGGLSEMILAGGALGGDERRISLAHAARILIAIFSLSFGYRWFGGYVPPVAGSPALSTIVEIEDWLALTGCGIVGYLGARALRIPAYALVGPMVLSAIVHVSGLTVSRPPIWLIAAAQVIIGSMVGARFDGMSLRTVGHALLLATGATVVLLGLAILFGEAVETALGIPFAAALLAFSPGGLAEMSLIALAMNVDAAYVSSHHIARIFMIVLAAPLLFRLLRRDR